MTLTELSKAPFPCREWQGSRTAHGYGHRKRDGRDQTMHRWIVEQVGEDKHGVTWDPSLVVRHDCDNRACFNYWHIRLGTSADNTADMMSRERNGWGTSRGELNANARLTAADVASIRQRYGAGELQRNIAFHYGIAQTTVSAIVRGKTWPHPPGVEGRFGE